MNESFLLPFQRPWLKGKSYRTTKLMHTYIDNHEETVIHNCAWCLFVLLFKFNRSRRLHTQIERFWHARAREFMVNGRKLNFITADCMLFTVRKSVNRVAYFFMIPFIQTEVRFLVKTLFRLYVVLSYYHVLLL